MKNRFWRVAYWGLVVSTAFILAIGAAFTVNVPSVHACYTWAVGQRVGLKRGAEIREGSALSYRVHTLVPEDNWQVDIINGPRYADGQEWWDISRRNIDGGGTGWVYKSQAGYDLCGSNPSPGKLALVQDLSVSKTNPYVNEQVSGTYRVKTWVTSRSPSSTWASRAG